LDRDRAPGILALTGQAYPEDAERCHKAGADRFLTKPTSLRRMDEVLQDLVQIVRQRRSAV
jgi:CheY-like chemotaxis protein